MSSFPGSPKLTKGAIVSIDLLSLIPQAVVFQYNPDSLTRSLEPQYGKSGGSRAEALRLKGAPVETISLDAEFDATDNLEFPDQNPDATSMGILPQLAALEMMLYPKSSLVIANTVLAALGTMELVPRQGPFTVFVWGVKRILPVRLTEYRITEEAYDTNLNPTRAKVSIGMRVLTYDDLDLTHPGYTLFLIHQIMKEGMAAVGSIGNIAAISSSQVRLF